MGEVYASEERTEPFTDVEYNARLQESIHVEHVDAARHDSIPLDKLVVEDDHHKQGIRILVRPLTRSRSVSPGNDNCRWLALRAEVSDPQQPSSQVLAVTQTSKDINFSIRLRGGKTDDGDEEDEVQPPMWCELYYDPASDSLILWNKSDIPIVLTRVSRPDQHGDHHGQLIEPGTTKEVSPGTWRITINGIAVLDFRILAKPPVTRLLLTERSESSSTTMTSSTETLNSSIKRSFWESDDPNGDPGQLSVTKRVRTMSNGSAGAEGSRDGEKGNSNGVIVFRGPRDEPIMFPLPSAAKTKEVAIPNGHALLQVDEDETIAVPGGCELDQYQLTKRDQIAVTAASSVFTADHSDVPEGVITVKVLKTGQQRPRPPHEAHRNVIRQADVWLREYQSQEDLQHESIVKLYGGDARYLSLYMEHVDGKDLAARNMWRDPGSDLFVGNKQDAERILKDIAGALQYVHQKRKIHNDIKPANILYSRDRGAVLCDFGLSTRTTDMATNGGTPYYIPPEFIGQKLRGAASDVWALGVTMLYVLRKIAFPDARGRPGHPRQLYWMIADINRRSTHAGHHGHHARNPQSAAAQMQQWLGEVRDARARLNQNDRLESLVFQMLIPNPNQRITMAKVMAQLFVDASSDSKRLSSATATPAAPPAAPTAATGTTGTTGRVLASLRRPRVSR